MLAQLQRIQARKVFPFNNMGKVFPFNHMGRGQYIDQQYQRWTDIWSTIRTRWTDICQQYAPDHRYMVNQYAPVEPIYGQQYPPADHMALIRYMVKNSQSLSNIGTDKGIYGSTIPNFWAKPKLWARYYVEDVTVSDIEVPRRKVPE